MKKASGNRRADERGCRHRKEHEERYRKLAANIENGKVFAKDEEVVWQCSNCGHQFVGKEAPDECPVCHHAQAYFQVKAENY